MLPTSLTQPLRRLWTLEPFAYSLRVFIALAGAMATCWYLDDMGKLIPLFLGIIASALAETDDTWQGRLQALLVTLVCFGVAALSVELTFAHPLAFAVGLGVSSFALTMLGAVGQRYATIATATLILAIYTMISLEQRGGVALGELWREPLLLVGGAAWYGAISVVWCALFSRHPLKLSLAQVFRELGVYLSLKSALFEPLRGLDIEQRRLALARQNGRVVAALNQSKEMIFRRLEGQRGGRKLNRYLRLYFIAQDIHERASSSHYPYGELAEAFFHHDILFRAQRLLDQQGRTCKALSRALLLDRPFDHGQSAQALEDLNASLAHLRAQQRDEWRDLLRSLAALADNLATLEDKLASADNPDARADNEDSSLFDRSPRGLGDIADRLRSHLTLSSPVFRHALRLSVTLLAGYGVLHWIHPTQGYWILLTSVFVCRPNFGATRRFLRQRIQGTVLGLIAGWALITLFPAEPIQALIAVAAGVAFFATRARHYTLATAAITLMVLCCFNQVGDGFGLIWPRLFDTLLGAAIAGLAVLVILPDWQGRGLHRQAATTLEASAAYLRAILAQYAQGKRDDLAYRLARRNAHNADATLSTSLGNVLLEPGHFRKDADLGLRFLVQSHTLLGYLSALGAHRGAAGAAGANDAAVMAAGEEVADTLEHLARQLAARATVAVPEAALMSHARALEAAAAEEAGDERRLLQTQLALVSRQLVAVGESAERLSAQASREQGDLK
ncbi:YccS family putative transporter [Chromohalobacter israelensis]|uniref:YccS family putative transporter n=1 Tax=Chromohalobacter israelensis TaxID=141390 RepID=UPI000FFF2C1B|nr:YccS family putative transporter [Chromohalobacter salexigens]RXE46503.1 TIGR01666 family membrane protein [Chromohalobacter salexigens]